MGRKLKNPNTGSKNKPPNISNSNKNKPASDSGNHTITVNKSTKTGILNASSNNTPTKLNGTASKKKVSFTINGENSQNNHHPNKPNNINNQEDHPNTQNRSNGIEKASKMHKSPSLNTLNIIERQKIVLWYWPHITLWYFVMEILCLFVDGIKSIFSHWRKIILAIVPIVPLIFYYYTFPDGIHWQYSEHFQKQLLWCLYWIGLGVLSSIGLGTGLHTFVIYLGPHIARVTMAAFECNSLNFPEPPYPDDVVCPNGNGNGAATAVAAVSLWQIISKVRIESLMWGAGTALGELPPFFMARAARLSGEVPDDEDLREFLEWQKAANSGSLEQKQLGIFDKMKLWMEMIVTRVGFFGILLFASIPNPFFDLAGITCGHFLIPFWTFFGATLIGKALVKMHIQMLFVVLAFSEHHVEKLLDLINMIPNVGNILQAPLKQFLAAQKMRLHRKPTDPVPEQASSMLQTALSALVAGMILWFLVSLINSLAQRYHKRLWEAKKRSMGKKTQ